MRYPDMRRTTKREPSTSILAHPRAAKSNLYTTACPAMSQISTCAHVHACACMHGCGGEGSGRTEPTGCEHTHTQKHVPIAAAADKHARASHARMQGQAPPAANRWWGRVIRHRGVGAIGLSALQAGEAKAGRSASAAGTQQGRTTLGSIRCSTVRFMLSVCICVALRCDSSGDCARQKRAARQCAATLAQKRGGRLQRLVCGHPPGGSAPGSAHHPSCSPCRPSCASSRSRELPRALHSESRRH